MTDSSILILAFNLGLFLLSAAAVWIAGARLAYLADALAERLQLAKSLVGLLLLASATSLPEIATTLSAAAQQNQALVLNNLFGGIALQTAVLALADFWARGAITNYPRKATHALEAALLVVLLALTLVILILGEPLVVGSVGMGSLLIALFYAGSIWLLRRYDAASDWIPVDLPDAETDALDLPLRPDKGQAVTALAAQSAIACAVILVFGLGLVLSSEAIARHSGLGASFIGVTMLAAATSLPEITTTIAAVRLGAYTMAISNIFGSNLIMLVLVFPADLLFVSGPIMRNPGATVPLAICFGVFVTGVYMAGLLVRRKPRVGAVGLDSAVVLVAFASSLLAYYVVRNL